MNTRQWGIVTAVLLTLVVIAALNFAVTNAASANTILTVYGLPAGSSFVWRIAPNYTTVTTPITNYTTKIPIYISNATNTTYQGAVPWQYQGVGTTVTYNGVTYTMLTGNSGTCNTQIVDANGLNNFCSFYLYLNASLWNTNESAELKASNSSLQTAKIVVKSIQNTSTSKIYNQSAAAGSIVKSATDNNGTIDFVSTTVTKASSSPCIYINLVSGAYCANATTPLQIHVPIINGKVGLTGLTYYWLNVTFVASLLGSNQANFNYSIKDITNGTTLQPLTTVTSTSSLNVQKSYKIQDTQSVEVVFDSSGNANYSPVVDDPLTVPSGLLYYAGISLQNANTAATSNGMQANIPFNALTFSTYEATDMQNVEFFYANGSLVNSWLEGNVQNEQQTKSLATSATLLYWIHLNPSIAGSTTSTNAVYVGFASTGTNLLTSGGGTGVAPQLYNSTLAPQTTYGQYDNGGQVFNSFYDGFEGTALSASLTSYLTGGGGYSQNNGITITGSGADSQLFTTANALQHIVEIDSNAVSTATGDVLFLGFETTTSSNPCAGGFANGYFIRDTYSAGTTNINGYYVNTCASPFVNTNTGALTAGGVIGFIWQTGSELWQYNYATTASGTDGNFVYTKTHQVVATGGSGTVNLNINWMRTRVMPPGDVPLGVTYGPLEQTSGPLANVVMTPNTVTIDNGESLTFNGLWQLGTPPFNAILVSCTTLACTSNSVIQTITNANSPVAFNAVSPTSNTIYRVNVQDAEPAAANSLPGTVTVDTALKANTATVNSIGGPTTANIDDGQSIKLYAQPSAGTPPYTTYTWYTDTSGTCSTLTPLAGTSNTEVVSPTSNTMYCYAVTDSAFIPSVATTTTPTVITVNPTFTAGNPTPSVANVINGGSELLTANPSGGTPTFSYQWYEANSPGTCSTGSTLIGGATGGTYDAMPSSNTLYCYTATDSAFAPQTFLSGNSLLITGGQEYQLVSVTLASTGYETVTQNPVYVITITPGAVNGTVWLNVNGRNVSYLTQAVTGSPQTFILGYPLPLLVANDVVYTYNAFLKLDFTPTSNVVYSINSIKQTELWNYIPSVTSEPHNSIIGNNITFNTTIADLHSLGLATVAGEVLLGNKSIGETIVSNYNYKAVAKGFIPSKYALTMPTANTPITYTANSAVQLFFMGANVFRNVSTTFTTYYETVGECGGGGVSNTVTLTWNGYNTSTVSAWSSNILVQGFFNVYENGYSGPTINGINAGFTTLPTSSSYQTCIYPTWANFGLNATLQYSSPAALATAVSHLIYHNYPISNVTQAQILYLQPNYAPLQYEVFVQNSSTQVFVPALVEVGLWNPNTNTTVPVDYLNIPGGQGQFTYLQLNQSYKFYAFSPNGHTLLASTAVFQAVGCPSTICDEVIPLGTFTIRLPSSFLDNINDTCPVTTSGNTAVVTCTWNVKSGGSYPFQLTLAHILANVSTIVCQQNLTASFGTVACSAPFILNNSYTWSFGVYLNGTTTSLQHGTIGQAGLLFGLDGVWVALLVIIALAGAYLSKNANMVIIMFDIGFIGMTVTHLLNLPFGSTGTFFAMGGLIMVSALILYVINRRER